MYTCTETLVSCWEERKVEWTERIRDATELRQIALITIDIKGQVQAHSVDCGCSTNPHTYKTHSNYRHK